MMRHCMEVMFDLLTMHCCCIGGTFLYCAPDDARDGMEQFVEALAAVNLKCVSQQPCPDE